MVLTWLSLTTPNIYGECAVDDIAAVVERAIQWIRDSKAEPELAEDRWVRQILHYLLARQKVDANYIHSTHTVYKPAGWKQEDETAWCEWVRLTFDQEVWEQRVLTPVFGTDQRLWEVNNDAWRTDILTFLPMWIRRDMDIVARFTQPDNNDEMESDSLLYSGRKQETDPYILEQEEKRRR
jgi:hypothetical protein